MLSMEKCGDSARSWRQGWRGEVTKSAGCDNGGNIEERIRRGKRIRNGAQGSRRIISVEGREDTAVISGRGWKRDEITSVTRRYGEIMDRFCWRWNRREREGARDEEKKRKVVKGKRRTRKLKIWGDSSGNGGKSGWVMNIHGNTVDSVRSLGRLFQNLKRSCTCSSLKKEKKNYCRLSSETKVLMENRRNMEVQSVRDEIEPVKLAETINKKSHKPQEGKK